MIRISVIVPTFERGEIFTTCLNSIVESVGPQDEIIVVNDSKQTSVQIKNSDSRIAVFDNPKSGVASARNFGAEQAHGNYLLFIDDDMLINKEAIESCFQVMLQFPNSAVNSDWVYNPEDLKEIRKTSFGRYLENIQFTSLKGWCTDLTWTEKGLVEAKGITSQFLLLQKSTFKLAGGYKELFPFAGFEDYDFGKRLQTLNVHFLINTNCCVFHNEKDRMEITSFLDRKKRGAITRKKAVLLGHDEVNIHYSKPKQLLYRLLSFLRPILLLFVRFIPNHFFWDKLYMRILNRLTGIYIFDGYNSKP